MNKNYFKLFIIILFLSSCSALQSTKQINLIDKNITNIQSEVKEVKNNIKKTKQAIIKIKQEQPACNLAEIDDRIEILDIQINSIDNNLFNTKQQIEISKDIIKMEVKEYKSKYHKCIIFFIIQNIIFILIVSNRIKLNISSIIGYIKDLFVSGLRNKERNKQ